MWENPRFRTYTSDSSVLYLVINLSMMFRYSLVLFTSSTIENFVIFCSLKEKLVKYVGFGRTQRMVIVHACMISHKISVMCGVEIFSVYFWRKDVCVKCPSQFFILKCFFHGEKII